MHLLGTAAPASDSGTYEVQLHLQCTTAPARYSYRDSYTYTHRWAPFQNSNRQLPFIVCRPQKTNFCLPFPVSFCTEQTEVCRFSFLFAPKKRKLPFSLVPFCVCVWVMFVYVYNYIYIYMLPFQTENGSPGDFPYSVYHLLIVQRKFVVYRFFEANGSYPFSNGLVRNTIQQYFLSTPTRTMEKTTKKFIGAAAFSNK
jgi:hypothetical protein